MKVLICDPTESDALEAISAAGIDVVDRPDVSPDELMEIIGEYEGMVVRSRTKVREPLIDKAENLKVIVRGGVGLDNIDVAYARSKGVAVLNTPAASSDSVAELTIGYLFALARNIPQMTVSMHEGKWEKKKFKGTEIAGKTLGLVGFGRIGQATGKRAHALGMKVVFYRRSPTDVPYAEQVSLAELLAQADYVSLHVPHTEETHHIVDTDAINQMKKGVYIVNCGRGGTIDEDALYDAIVAGKVAGAALDVFEEEPAQEHRLFTLSQVIGSPHVGAATKEAQGRVGAEVRARGHPDDQDALRASGTVRITDLSIRDEPLLLNLLALLHGVPSEETPFDEGRVRFEIEGTRLRILEAEVLGPRWGLRGEGTIELGGRTVDLEVVLVSRRDPPEDVPVEGGRLREITDALRERVARARIHGSYDRLRVTSVALAEIRGRMVDFVGRVLGR